MRGGGISSKSFTGFHFTGDQAELLLLATAPFYLRGVLMKPHLTLLTPEKWAVIGPFEAGTQSGDDIKKTMASATQAI